MADTAIAALFLAMYMVNDQWAFRCQRVGRGILLFERDSAAAFPELFASIMPARYVASVWVGRLILAGTVTFAWRAWGWVGVLPVILYAFVLGALIDAVSPWPSYRSLLRLFEERIRTGAAGADAMQLLLAVRHIQRELEAGVGFEKAATGVWLNRAEAMAKSAVPRRTSEISITDDDVTTATVARSAHSTPTESGDCQPSTTDRRTRLPCPSDDCNSHSARTSAQAQLFTEYELPPEKAVQERRAAGAVDMERTETQPDDRPASGAEQDEPTARSRKRAVGRSRVVLLQGLQRQRLVIDQIAQVGYSSFANPGARSSLSIFSGERYAYEFHSLSATDVPWHWTLMRAALVALRRQQAKSKILAGYEVSADFVKLFLFTRRDSKIREEIYRILAGVPGYLEYGPDRTAIAHLRPLAYWTPPSTLVALWPLPIDERPGPYALDAGNLLNFSSYPEADHDDGLALDLAGPDYLRVPTDPAGTLEPESIAYLNRWADLEYPNPRNYS